MALRNFAERFWTSFWTPSFCTYSSTNWICNFLVNSLDVFNLLNQVWSNILRRRASSRSFDDSFQGVARMFPEVRTIFQISPPTSQSQTVLCRWFDLRRGYVLSLSFLLMESPDIFLWLFSVYWLKKNYLEANKLGVSETFICKEWFFFTAAKHM